MVVLIFALIIGSSLTFLMQKYMLSSEEEALLQNAQEIRDLTVFLLENESSAAFGLYQRSLNSYAYQLNSSIFVTDSSGKVMLAASENQSPKVGVQLEISVMDEVLNGKTVRQWGTLDGTFSEKRLNIVLPLILKGKVGGALFLSSPMPQIHFFMMDVFKILMLSLLFSLAVSFLIVFFISQRISRPIQKIKQAAEEFAQGRFDVRISNYPDDEIGELSVAFNNMARSLNELEQNRRMFVANVSHELRSPLTTISGFVQGILDGTIPDEKKEDYLRIVLDEVKRMSRLVNDLLYMERSNKEELRESIFDLNELIRLVLIGFESRITEKRIEVAVEFCRDVQPVRADRDGILRVVTNLLDNAVKFTPQGGRITVSLSEELSLVRVSIGNTGEAIPPQVLPHIFERFYKADLSRGMNKSGTGLGLHIVKTILARHGQSIKVTSDREHGTVFVFTLSRQK